MTFIKDILELNLGEDIKSVIDVQDQTEEEIQYELESYIVTENLSGYFSKFLSIYGSNSRETGVWISGFFGSGKSYFAKVLGHILTDRKIIGTHARDRFIPRLRGLRDENLLENEIRKLDAYKTRVVSLNISHQDTQYGLSYTLFKNFLKTLGFLDSVYGYLEYSLFLEGDYENYLKKVKEITGEDWDTTKRIIARVPSTMKKILSSYKYSDSDYEDTKKALEERIRTFDPDAFKHELENYFSLEKEETLVFFIDETSEGIKHGKIEVMELAGLSEALSTIGNRVWTVCVAQEKLDDVINSASISRSELNKITDRFRTKIPLESTDVDIIIRTRLLRKKDAFKQQIIGYFKENEGKIADLTQLNSSFPTRIDKAESFSDYYPFYPYQFRLLQDFLFSSRVLAATQIAARGMIITTFDVMRKRLKDKKLYETATSFEICSEAQTAPPSSLVAKFDTATKILQNQKSKINGEELLKVIHFLSESERVATTAENITKCFLSGPDNDYYLVKPNIDEALQLLVEAKVLLLSSGTYKITSDLETRLLDELNIHVELYVKKVELTKQLKKLPSLKDIGSLNEGSVTYPFHVTSDMDDDIFPSSSKHLRIIVYNLYNINEDLKDFIEHKKLATQYDKNQITIIPDNSRFSEIDKLFKEVKQFYDIEDKYKSDSDTQVKHIIRNLAGIRETKEQNLFDLMEESYYNGYAIYLFHEYKLSKDKFKTDIKEIEKKLVKNVYTKNLSRQLTETIALPVLTNEPSGLHRLFSGEDFNFFDKNGNFIGDHLTVIEELTIKIKSSFVDGKSLEEDLSAPPTGYQYGTLCTTVAVLLRAGKLAIKFSGKDYFSYTDPGIKDIFSSSRNFQKASFKSISRTLDTSLKNEIVQILLDLDFKGILDKKVDWNTNDFELVTAIKDLAEFFVISVKTMNNTHKDFENRFKDVFSFKGTLQNFTGTISENNYIDKADYFLDHKTEYIEAINKIKEAEKFIKRNLVKVDGFELFVEQVEQELMKAGISSDEISNQTHIFRTLYENDIVTQFAKLQEAAQKIKDEYFNLMKTENEQMTAFYKTLKAEVETLLTEIRKYPLESNEDNLQAAEVIFQYADKRINPSVELEYHIECKNCHYSLSEMQNYNALVSTKESEMLYIRNNIVTNEPTSGPTGTTPRPPKKIKLKITSRIMKAKEYRALLSDQIKSLAGTPNDQDIELDIEKPID
ncbi:BREX system P-loop protein BrxC [candidate division KSB1 bacterium]